MKRKDASALLVDENSLKKSKKECVIPPKMKYNLEIVRKNEKRIFGDRPKPIYELDGLKPSYHCDKNEKIQWFTPSAIQSSFLNKKEKNTNERIVVKIEKDDENVEERPYGISLSSLIPKNIIENALSYAKDVCKEEYEIEEEKKSREIIVLSKESKYKDTMRGWLHKKHPNCCGNIMLSKEVPLIHRCFTSIPLSRLEENIFDMLSMNSNGSENTSGYKCGRLTSHPSMLYHETVYKNEACRFFYDFDCKIKEKTEHVTKTVEKCLFSINEYICERLVTIHSSVKVEKTIFAISWDSSNDQKISKHVFFSNENDSFRFRNKKTVGIFLKTCLFEWLFTECCTTFDDNIVKLVLNSFDIPLYERSGEFRIPFSTKLNVKRYLVPDYIFRFVKKNDTALLDCKQMILLKSPKRKKKKEKEEYDDLYFSDESVEKNDSGDDDNDYDNDNDNDGDDTLPEKKWNQSFVISKSKLNDHDDSIISPEGFYIHFFSTEELQFDLDVLFFHEHGKIGGGDNGQSFFVDWRWLFKRSLVNFIGENEKEEEEEEEEEYGDEAVSHFYYFKMTEKHFISFFKKNQELISNCEDGVESRLFGRLFSPDMMIFLKDWFYNRLSGNDNKYKGETPSEIVSKLHKYYITTRNYENSSMLPSMRYTPTRNVCEDIEIGLSHDFVNSEIDFSNESFKSWILDRVKQENNNDSVSEIVSSLLENDELDAVFENMVRDIKIFIPDAFRKIWDQFSISVGDLSFKIRQKQARFKFVDKSDPMDSKIDLVHDKEDSTHEKLTDEDILFENTISRMFLKHSKEIEMRRLISSASMRFELENCKFCPIKYDRCMMTAHKNNHTFFTVDFLRKKMYLGCHNEACYKHSSDRKSAASFYCDVPPHLSATMNIFLQFHVFLRSLE